MKRFTAVFSLCILMYGNSFAQHLLNKSELTWLQEHLVSFDKPIREFSNEDYRQMPVEGKVRIVGLGEANHGTKEITRFRQGYIKHLVEEQGFNAIVMEYPFSEALLIDQYIKGENQKGLEILTNSEYYEVNNPDMVALIEELKAINQHRKKRDKVSFLGADGYGKPTAVMLLTEYFAKVDKTQAKFIGQYDYLAEHTYLSIGEQNNKDYVLLGKRIKNILKDNKETYIQLAGREAYFNAFKLSEVLAHRWFMNSRNCFMASTIKDIVRFDDHNKVIFLAHNAHVGRFRSDVGKMLNREFGSAYFTIGTDYNQGWFSLYNRKHPLNTFRDSVEVGVLENSFAYHVNQKQGKIHYMCFDHTKNRDNKWLFRKNYFASTGFGFDKDFESQKEFRIRYRGPKRFDAMVIFEAIKPTFPILDNENSGKSEENRLEL
jgi:erythromycin esterase